MSSRIGALLLLVLVAVLGVSLIGMTQQSPQGSTKRTKWEYKVVALERFECTSDAGISNSLLTLGQQGWELVSYAGPTPPLPQDAEGTLSISPAATGTSRDVNPPTADSFQGRISMKMSQTSPGNCLIILKREQLPTAAR